MKIMAVCSFAPLLFVALAACHQHDAEHEQQTDSVHIPVADSAQAVPEAGPMSGQSVQAAKPKAAKRAVRKTAEPPAETLYVETEAMQGRVWGYVTMHGITGSGTIHDWDENTLSITVTRHGNELYAVDQNSRHYVFRLK